METVVRVSLHKNRVLGRKGHNIGRRLLVLAAMCQAGDDCSRLKYRSKSTSINSNSGGGQICTTLRQGRRLLQVLCQCLEPKMLGDGSQQVGEGGTHPGQHHKELQEEEEGSVRDVQGRGCVHHQEHPHWPGLVLENKLHSHCSVSSLARLSTSISNSTRRNTGWVVPTKRLGTLLGLDSASASL